MLTLLKNGFVINVFTGEIEKANVLISDDKIVGVGDYTDDCADAVFDVSQKFISPGFIDGHIHIESTMLTPGELSKALLLCGTTSIVADPHEIANVCGKDGIRYMLSSSENLPLNIYIMLPSCVPSTDCDESGATLNADDLLPFYKEKRVLGLAEVMNYPGVVNGDSEILKKISDAISHGKKVDGHAPLLCGKDLDKYISYGIQSDHECSSFEEARERIRKGQYVMIRNGTAAKNLSGLIDILDEPYFRRALLVTDDKHPEDIVNEGHINSIIRQAVKSGKSAVNAICAATTNAAQCFGLDYVGAIAPGYRADIVVLNNLTDMSISSVYSSGKEVVCENNVCEIAKPKVSADIEKSVKSTFNVGPVCPADFKAGEGIKKCRVIKTIKNELLTKEEIREINFDLNGGTDVKNDILKIAVIERHKHTGHKAVGFISGLGLKKGALASSVSHDSHNIVAVGTNDDDIAFAVNHIIKTGGGIAAVSGGKILSDIPLPIAGLMSDKNALEVAYENERLSSVLKDMGVPSSSAPIMTMAFMCLSVIPDLKITTKGLFDVKNQKFVSLFA